MGRHQRDRSEGGARLLGARPLVVLVVVAASALALPGVDGPNRVAAPRPAAARPLGADGSLRFERNDGQFGVGVEFVARARGHSIALGRPDATVALQRAGARPVSLDMRVLGGDPEATVTALDRLPGTANYYVGDPSTWRTGVPTFGRVRYDEVYRSVDLEYYGNAGRLEYDFVVRPGGDPSDVRMAFPGADVVALDKRGDLDVRLSGAALRLHAPVIHQDVGGTRRLVDGGFRLLGTGVVGVWVGDHDATLPLVIDPVLEYSTYLGGGGFDWGADVAVDDTGATYVTGTTASVGFPATPILADPDPGLQDTSGSDAYVMKLSADGSTAVYTTYLGGAGEDYGNGIDVHPGAGTVLVTGSTGSGNPGAFPTTPGAFQASLAGDRDAFVTKLDASGAIAFSTYLGGYGDESGAAVTADGWVVGSSDSGALSPSNPPVVRPPLGGRDAFVVKLTGGGTGLEAATFVGGVSSDDGLGIVSFGPGALAVGQTCSGINPGDVGIVPTGTPYQAKPNGGCDALIARVGTGSPGTVSYVGYLGGSQWDLARDVVACGSAYCITGETQSADFPTKGGVYQTEHKGGYDAFVTVLDPDKEPADELIRSTLLGGSGDDHGYALALDGAGTVHLVGATTSTGLKVAKPLPGGANLTGPGTSDAFVSRFAGDLSSLIFFTYLGSSGHDAGLGIAVDDEFAAYVTGSSSGTGLATTGALQQTKGALTDGFLAKIGTPACQTTGVGPLAFVGRGDPPSRVDAIDLSTGCVVASVPMTQVEGITVTPDGTRVLVSRFESDQFVVLERGLAIDTLTVGPTVQFGNQASFFDSQQVAVHPDALRIYALSRATKQFSVVEHKPATGAYTETVLLDDLVDNIPLNGPRTTAVSPNGKFAYVTQFNDKQLMIFDTATNAFLETVFTLSGNAWGVIVSPDGARVYVSQNNSALGVIAYDDATGMHTQLADVPLSIGGANDRTTIAVHPTGNFVYASNNDATVTAVVDLAVTPPAEIATIPADADYGIAVSDDGKWIVLSDDSATTVVDAATRTIELMLPPSHLTGPFFISPVDKDDDGIMDRIDAGTNAFSDTNVGGTITGSITDRGGLDVRVWDSGDENSVYARAIGNPASTAALQVCGFGVDLSGNDVTEFLTCKSLSMNVLVGPVEADLDDGAQVSVPTGGKVTVTERPPGRFQVENRGTVPLTIVDDDGETLATVAAGRTAVHDTATVVYDHLAASDNVSLAVRWSSTLFADGDADEAVLVRSDSFADSLAAGALAGAIGAPVLMTPPGASVDDRVLDELARLGVDRVWAIGGTAAVSAAAVSALEVAGYDVLRLAGADRTATAAAVLAGAGGGDLYDGVDTVYLARAFADDASRAFADSLGAGMVAGSLGRPLLLTETGRLSSSSRAAIEASGATIVVVAGGTAAVSEAVVEELRAMGVGVLRIAGADRFATASSLAGASFDEDRSRLVALVEGLDANSWASGFAAAAAAGGAVLLADGAALPAPTVDRLAAIAAATGDAVLVCAPEVDDTACARAAHVLGLT